MLFRLQLKAVNDKQSFQLAANSREIERLQEEEKVLIGKVAILEREKDLLEAASGPRKASPQCCLPDLVLLLISDVSASRLMTAY